MGFDCLIVCAKTFLMFYVLLHLGVSLSRGWAEKHRLPPRRPLFMSLCYLTVVV